MSHPDHGAFEEEPPHPAAEPSQRIVLPIALFAVTLLSTWYAGAVSYGPRGGVLFACALMSILVAHEMGHYVVARYHKVQASLPHFIPMPFLMLGTLGAVIALRTDKARRNQLMDIGAAGPLAGFAVAVPLMAVGVHVAKVVPLRQSILERVFAIPEPTMLTTFGSLFLVSKEMPAMYFGDSILSYVLVTILRSDLLPGHDLVTNPIWIGAWAGFLVTAINLLPMGQLDGGHVMHALSPGRSEKVARATFRVLVILGVIGLVVHGPTIVYDAWPGAASKIPAWVFATLRPLFPWFSIASLIWAVFGRVTGLRHPRVQGENEPLTRGRRAIAFACLVVFALTFMPNPAWMDRVWLSR